MKPENISNLYRVFSTALLACLISSCAMPTNEAWRIVQKDGLFNYWAGNYTTGSYTSAAPFQTTSAPYAAPRPINQVPYRTTYHSNRYRVADYNRVPYRPKTVTSNGSSARKSSPSRPKDYNKPRAHSSLDQSPAPESEIAHSNPASATKQSTPSSTPADSTAAKPADTLPYGTPVTGRPGMVTSPFAQKQQLVDVTGLAPGDTVKDPYSGKLFKVPPTTQAAATKPATLEANQSAPASADQPKAPSKP